MKSNLPERPHTIKEAAALLGLPTWKLQRAVGKGLVPSYTFLNRRKLVRLSEVDGVIKQSRHGCIATTTASGQTRSLAAHDDDIDGAFDGGSHE